METELITIGATVGGLAIACVAGGVLERRRSRRHASAHQAAARRGRRIIEADWKSQQRMREAWGDGSGLPDPNQR